MSSFEVLRENFQGASLCIGPNLDLYSQSPITTEVHLPRSGEHKTFLTPLPARCEVPYGLNDANLILERQYQHCHSPISQNPPDLHRQLFLHPTSLRFRF